MFHQWASFLKQLNKSNTNRMTPTEKARELVNKMYYVHGNIDSDMAKKCALIAVDEILLSNPTWFVDQMKSTHKYWEDVRNVLNTLEKINSDKINQFTKVSKGNSEPYISNIYSIPLTEKWLIDLGFEPSAFTGLYYDKEGIIDIQISWDNKFTLFYKNCEIREVESVHDLQNLYFALTKDELKIN